MAGKSLNRVTLLGNLGQDPELRTTPAGSYVTTLKIATSETYKDKSGNNQESTEWHSVVVWDKLAEIAHQYLKKGSRVLIEGKIKYRSYEKDGITRYMTEIYAQNMIMLSSGGTKESGEYSSYSQDSGAKSNYKDDPPNMPDFNDDDVPF